MTTAAEAPAWGPAEIDRDRFGRPLVVPPGGGKAVPYTRCTTFVGCLEDTYNLSKWQQRAVAVGLASRPDLLLKVNSLGPQPEDPNHAKPWKAAMTEACEAAMEAAKSSASATIGTALHALTERIDRGQDVGPVPDSYKPHLAAYANRTKGFTALHIEQFTVHDGLKIGGTPDRVITIDGLPGAFISDLKTGDTEYGVGKMAMQLAVYANSVIYDPATGQRRPYAAPVSTERGLIIALSAKAGTCELKWVDLQAGWEAVSLAYAVRSWRARGRDLVQPYDVLDGAVDAARDLVAEAEAALRVAIDQAATPEDLVELWRKAGTAWTDEHTARAAARKAALRPRIVT